MFQSTLPLLDNATMLPSLIDFHLEHNPDSTFAIFPSSSSDTEVSTITFLEFGRACHRFARLTASIAQRGEVVGLIANADTLLYVTAVAGFARAGITVFPISPRNSPAAVISMLRKVSAHRLVVTSPSLQPLLSGIEEELVRSADDFKLSFVELPGLPEVYPRLAHECAEDAFTPVPLPPRDAFKDEVVLYIHSSGSTGYPKPIPYSHEVIADQRYNPMNEEMIGKPRDIIFGVMALPSFHTMGIYSQLFYPLFTGRPIAIFTPNYPQPPVVSAPDVALKAMQQTKSNVILVVPTFLELWTQVPEAIAYLKTLHFAAFGGGPLATGFGDQLVSAGVTVSPMYGGTEFGIATCFWPPVGRRPEDWAWLAMADHVHPRWINAGEGQHELQLLTCETHKLSVEDLPDVRGYATRDVWVPHPTQAGLWRIVGRADDVLILANGEKVVPGPIEGVVSSSARVRGAVLFGRERNQVGVLVEPASGHEVDPTDEAALARFRNEVWPKVDEANRDAPAFARIFKEMILVTSPSKPLPRAPKGTIKRKAALQEYEQEIQALYETVENSGKDDSVSPPSEWTLPEITHWVTELCSSVREGRKPDPHVDLFEQGFDSLSVTFLRNRIIGGLRASADSSINTASTHIHNGLIYANPTVDLLASAIHAMVHANTGPARAPTKAIADMIAKYSADMPSVAASSAPKPDSAVVLLSGTTGGLGSQMLASCLEDEKVRKVYALNRPSAHASALARHEATFKDRGLDLGLLSSSKLVFVEGDAGKDWLGLDYDLYEEIRTSVTVIVHNAWRLDFNLSLASFESNIRGTRNLLDLALASPQAAHVRVLFTSTIAVSQAWPRERGLFPEEPMADATWAVGSGYGEGKYVSEQLLVKAADNGLQTTSFRIGQIAGSRPNGAWATTDWLPILVKSSLALGCFPEAQGVTSWLPFDAVASTILDVAFASGKPERALNVVHPRPVPWKSLFEALADVLASNGKRLPLVPWSEWQAMLESRAMDATEEDLNAIPGIKLQPFFAAQTAGDKAVRESGVTDTEAAGLSPLSTIKAQEASTALRELPPLDREDIGRWVAYWRSKRFIQ